MKVSILMNRSIRLGVALAALAVSFACAPQTRNVVPSGTFDGVASLQPQRQPAPGQSVQRQAGRVGTFMAISWWRDPADP